MTGQPGRIDRTFGLAELLRLGEAQQAVRSAPVRKLLGVLATQVRSLVGGNVAYVAMVDSGTITLRAVDGLEIEVGSAQPLPQGPSLMREAAESGLSSLTADAWSHAQADSARARQVEARSVITVPMVVGDTGAAAVLQVCHRDAGGFDELDCEIVEQLCRVARARLLVSRVGEDDETLRTTVLTSLDEGIMITRGREQCVVMTNAALERTFGLPPGWADGRPLQLGAWRWLSEDGVSRPTLEVPTWVAYRTGQPVYGELMCMVPESMDQHSPQGRAAMRWVVVSALPIEDPITGQPDAVVTRVRDVTAERLLEASRQDDADRLRTAQAVTGLAWTTYEPGRRLLTWSDEMYRIAGLDPAGPRIDIARFLAMVHRDDRWIFSSYHDIVESRTARTVHYRIVRPDGEIRVLQGWPEVQQGDGQVDRLHGAVFDVTERERILMEVADRTRQFRQAFDGAPHGMLVVSMVPARFGEVVRVNRALADLVERPLDFVTGMVQDVLASPLEDEERPVDLTLLLEAGERGTRIARRLLRADGSVLHAWITATPVLNSPATEPFVVVHVLDVTSQRNQQRMLEKIALTDAVTGLPNRSMVTVRLDQALGNDEVALAVMLLDLDRFKNVNDSLGHHIGDLLLVEVANRLRLATPKGSMVGRLGGDEFVLLLQGQPVEELHQQASAIIRSLAEPYELSSGHRVISSVSMGVAIMQGVDSSRHDLLRDADLALYRAKGRGRNQYAVCDEELHAQSELRLADEQRLRAGLGSGGLRLHLQPVYELVTGRLSGLEALVRLQDPDLGLIAPDRFITIAEETGLVAEIDHWVVDAALELVETDPRFTAEPRLRIGVNVSGRTLERPDFSARLLETIARRGGDPRRLVVEITESCLLEDDAVARDKLRELRALGILVCIDDFGTGYSALSYLQTFEVDVLKIDRTFVAGMDVPGRGEATVAAIITMSHALGLRVVAEGVETRKQHDMLLALGCDAGQGWHYGRPVPPLTSVENRPR